MSNIEKFAERERKIRPYILKLPPWLATSSFTIGRKIFLNSLINSSKSLPKVSPYHNTFKLWDIEFGAKLFNAAGMFKHGKGYELCVMQKAGAFLAGTTTATIRTGNIKSGIIHPFAAFPTAGCAINWMGLPNPGHEAIAKRLAQIDKVSGCPVGASVSASPDQTGLEALNSLVAGMRTFEKAKVDFLELNESCPNVSHECSAELINGLDKSLVNRLEFISSEFLKKRKRKLLEVVKFLVDTCFENLPELMLLILEFGFDGVNFGNTSTDYNNIIQYLNPSEKKLFDYFSRNFGGGASGNPIKYKSLTLASLASEYVRNHPHTQEFHIIRTGGVESETDLIESEKRGISLNQWFTGYFDSFSKFGHNVYNFEKKFD